MEQVGGVFGDVVSDVTSSSANALTMGFFLAAALAWNEVVKVLLNQFVGPRGSGLEGAALYAVLVTLVSTAVYSLVKRFVDVEKSNVGYVMTA